MKHYFFKKSAGILVLLLISTGLSFAQGVTQALIKTNFGNIRIKLYNDTPIHKANFIRLAKAGRYDGTLFFRVVKNFVIQGASSDSRNPKPGYAIGYGDGITIDAEIKPNHYHKRGALGAPRQPDREKLLQGIRYFTVLYRYRKSLPGTGTEEHGKFRECPSEKENQCQIPQSCR